MRIGKKEELLTRLAETVAGPAARPDGDEGLRGLEPFSQRVRLRVEERKDPLAAVTRRDDEDPEHGKARGGAEREIPQRRSRQKEEGRRDEHQRSRGAEVRLGENERGRDREKERGREDAPHEIVEPVALAVDLVGEKQDERDFEEFRRLQRELTRTRAIGARS